jgi:hypothetical protein
MTVLGGSRVTHLLVAAFVLAAAAAGGGCGSSNQNSSFHPGGGDDGGAVSDGSLGDSGLPGDGGTLLGDGSSNTSGFQVTPSTLQTITVTAGKSSPTVPFAATYNGSPVNIGWGVDQGNIGTIPAGPSSAASFAPTGTTGGVVNVLATYMGKTLKVPVLVKLTMTQNGSNPSNPGEAGQIPSGTGALSAGGGVGGVGGEGLGGPVTSTSTIAALQNPKNNGQAAVDAGGEGLTFLYPYDKTVWPRGMNAPLLMWSWAVNDADGILITLSTTSGSFTYSGTFGPPPILMTTNGPFIRMPIPQDVWEMATNTAGGIVNGKPDQLTLGLTVAKGGVGYGPITETWTVAPGLLTGTVYYNSYGTHFVKNWVNLDSAGNPVGAAILGIRSGDNAPTLVVGENSPLDANGHPTDDTGCRVCHVVSSHGKWLITQSEQGNPGDGQSYLYDLTQANVQGSAVTMTQQGTFTWAAMLSDGSYALTNEVNPSSTNPGVGTSTTSFWQFGPTPVAATLTGLPSGLAAGYPSFAPDNKFISYIDVTSSTTTVDGPLNVAAYDATNQTFSGVTTLAVPASGQRIGYPAFLPDDSGLLFETEVRSSTSDSVMVTRNGARSELWWVNATGTPKPVALANLNGKGYLPLGPNNHGASTTSDPQDSYDESGKDDTTLDYEPTVLPVVAGGYAWVVFTSRRMYGSELQSTPWLSWPPDYDTTSLAQATVKKLWVAAIDLNAPAGTDPSHPAFYLPAQELLAGNSRGFWVLDPCKQNGDSCQSGDQCCNGYCEPNGDGGALVCSTTPPSCSAVSDKCTTAADCCDSTNKCINGYCAQQGAQ